MAQAQRGDRKAIAQLYDELFPGVYAYARMRLPTPADAEDVVSETFLAVVKRLSDFTWRHAGSFRAWVFQIARNQIADFYRRNGRASMVSLAEAPSALVSEPSSLETSLISSETRKSLRMKIGELSPRRQEVVLMRYFGGLRNKEIAVALGLDERTVAAHLSRALAALQEELAADREVDPS